MSNQKDYLDSKEQGADESERPLHSPPPSFEHVLLSDADKLLKPGELSYEEVTAGGLGR